MDDFTQWLVFHIYMSVLVAERNLVMMFKSQTKRLLSAEDILSHITIPGETIRWLFTYGELCGPQIQAP